MWNHGSTFNNDDLKTVLGNCKRQVNENVCLRSVRKFNNKNIAVRTTTCEKMAKYIERSQIRIYPLIPIDLGNFKWIFLNWLDSVQEVRTGVCNWIYR